MQSAEGRAETRSTCCYCGVGCGVIIETESGRITNVRGDPDHPANYGRLCSKGSTLHLSTGDDGRVLHPELRRTRAAVRERAGWDEALDYAADRFAAIVREHGPDAVAFYVSGQLTTEDYYVFNKLAKGVVGTNNIDTNSRLCMSSAVAGYKLTLGADAPPACYADVDDADVILIAGSNTAWAHPVLFRRMEDARRRNPRQKWIVVDPRRTDTAAEADLHLPIRPGTDLALFNAMLSWIAVEGLLDDWFVATRTEDFDEALRAAHPWTPERAAQVCGVPARDIVTAALWFARAGASLSLYCQGLNQSAHGTANNAALVNLHLATGHIGRRGAGPLSLTGQPNAMGGREVGGMANLLSAHRDLANRAHRDEVARLWGVDAVPATPGLTAVELFDALGDGRVKAVWIACTNPAQSMPDQQRVRAALACAEFVVVQEAFVGADTVAYADLLLPATTWGEKSGTVTNSERCISRVRPAVAAPGEARDDWAIAVDFGRRLASRLERDGTRLLPYAGPEEVFVEHRESTRGRDLDITGLSYALLEQRGPQQWPFPEGAGAGRERLYADGIFPTSSGRARFLATPYVGVSDPLDAHHPVALLTGRLRDQWHGMTRTGRVARLLAHAAEPWVELPPGDMRAAGIVAGDVVRLTSRRGQMLVRAVASEGLAPGTAFLPMHWGAPFLAIAGVNTLTTRATDPMSRQPELKHTAVRVERVELPHEIVAMAPLERVGGHAGLAAAQPILAQFEYATLTLFGRDTAFVQFRARAGAPPDASRLARLDQWLGVHGPRAVTYRDVTRGVDKRAMFAHGRLVAVRLSGETAAAEWLRDAFACGATEGLRAIALAPLAAPLTTTPARGRTVCTCLDVGELQIKSLADEGATVEAIQSRLKCGTQCGSCMPEVRRLVAEGVRLHAMA
jgi:assimilatory nitrate reductase catalytic subunit